MDRAMTVHRSSVVRTGAHSGHEETLNDARRRDCRQWRADCLSMRRMSQKTVQFVIGWLLTDEDLRRRFVERPRETLDEVREKGYELTEQELDALARSDPTAWPSMARHIHPRLQRCSLRV